MGQIVCVRIDDRLLHSQTAKIWYPFLQADRLLIANDSLACNEERQELMLYLQSEKLKIDFFSITESANVLLHSEDRFFVVLASPKDVLRLMDMGIEINRVNVGNMQKTLGKQKISSTICVNDKDRKDFTMLKKRGVDLFIQTLPTSAVEDSGELFER